MPAEVAFRGGRTHPRSSAAREIPLAPPLPSEEQIRKRAYDIYLSRGATLGNPEWDWQQAELELKARIALLGRA